MPGDGAGDLALAANLALCSSTRLHRLAVRADSGFLAFSPLALKWLLLQATGSGGPWPSKDPPDDPPPLADLALADLPHTPVCCRLLLRDRLRLRLLTVLGLLSEAVASALLLRE